MGELKRPTKGVASRRARTSTVLGSLGRVGGVHGDNSRKLKREKNVQSTKGLTISAKTMRRGQKGGGQGEGRSFGCGKQLLAEKD